jgi:hypothetical protein
MGLKSAKEAMLEFFKLKNADMFSSEKFLELHATY